MKSCNTWSYSGMTAWLDCIENEILGKNQNQKRVKKGKKKQNDGKPAQLVARRNARERHRVEAVNGAFARLRKVVPIENNSGKRVSKVKMLVKAIEYIRHLQSIVQVHNNLNTVYTASKYDKAPITEYSCLPEMFPDYNNQCGFAD